MAKFFKFEDWDGKPSYLNVDLAREIKVEENEKSKDLMIHVIYENNDVNIPLRKNEALLRVLVEEPETEGISRNLYHIWEILRARLH